MRVLAVRLQFLESLEVEDVRAMDSQEACWVERLLEARDGLLLEALLAFRGECDVIVLRLCVIQLGHGNNMHVAAVAEHDAIGMLSRSASCAGQFGRNVLVRCHTLSSASERILKAF